MNAGQRGLQVRMKPADAARALDAKVVPLVAD
jgi:Cys-tRNA(Pro)/Cys-tRNA(Cys) deacylase